MAAIQHIARRDLDTDRWDRTVAADPSALPYAFSWYLDAVCGPHWSGLVAGDYAALMPLPWNRKLLGYYQLYRPVLCQQLGVYGPALSPDLTGAFLQAIPARYRYIHYPFKWNGVQTPSLPADWQLRRRQNLILDLSAGYEALWAGYSKSLRKRLRKAKPDHRVERSQDTGALLSYYRRELGAKAALKPGQYRRLERLFGVLLERDWADIYRLDAPTEGPGTRAMGLFVKTPGRIINVFGASDAEGRDLYSMHVLLDHLIERYAGQDRIFDFEGSDIPGVAVFFRSFGAEEEPYLEIGGNRLPTLLSRLLSR